LSDKPDDRIVFPKLQNFLRKSVHINEPNLRTSLGIRALIKWIFDLARNVMIVGVIQFLAKKTDSTTLNFLSFAGSGLLFGYLWTYIDSWALTPFHYLRNQTVAMILNSITHLSIVVALWGACQLGLFKALDAIATAYAVK
jgi:hypothetical protein